MSTAKLYEERKTAIHLLRRGCTPKEVATELNHSVFWVYKWQKRFEQNSWAGLHSQSRAPKQHGRRLTAVVQQAIIQARSELEAEAAETTGLNYVGGPASTFMMLPRMHRPEPVWLLILSLSQKPSVPEQHPFKPTSPTKLKMSI